jgi:uncharacterized protein (TIGR02145 family)
MKSFKPFLISLILTFSLFSVLHFLLSCKKDKGRVISVNTDSITSIRATSASAKGIIVDLGDGISQHGHCCDTLDYPTIDDNTTLNGPVSQLGEYTSYLTNLLPNTRYFVRAYVRNDDYLEYGSVLSFNTLSASLPSIFTAAITNISGNTAICGGEIISDGNADIIAMGVCWSAEPNPAIDDEHTIDSSSTGTFISNITVLNDTLRYYVRAYATNIAGTAYGNEVSFFAGRNIYIPTVVTSDINNIGATYVQIQGEVTSDGGDPVTERGIYWSTNPNPKLSDSKIASGYGIGSFICIITGLTPNTAYYAKAYAVNSLGTAFGDVIDFTTGDYSPIIITTTEVSSVNDNSAKSGGNITDDGGDAIYQRGVCWNTSQNPVITDNLTTDGEGTGSYVSSITGLEPLTTYYVRAYAINNSETAYGNNVNFTTLSAPTLAEVETTSASSITAESAISGGSISSDGGSAITAKGVCWSTSPNPTISDETTNEGSGTGTFTSSITGLEEMTTYYVRAYATNNVGTAYGNEIQFTTIEAVDLATINTTQPYNITFNSATTGGYIVDDGGGTITSKGICCGTNSLPTIEGSFIPDMSDLDSFTVELTDLESLTLYYVRSFAVNDAGISYGNQVSFTTSIDPNANWQPGDEWTDTRDGQRYNTVQIGEQVWLAENLNICDTISYSASDNGIIEKRCYKDNEDYCNTYGGIYRWPEMMQYAPSDDKAVGTTQGICPSGWHIPTDEEWKTLEMELGMTREQADSSGQRGTDQGTQLRQNGTSGFEALLGGYCKFGGCYSMGYAGCFFTATKASSISEWQRSVYSDTGKVGRSSPTDDCWYSVRCVKD